MSAPLLAEAGLRLTYSIGMVAALGFLGFSTDPGGADWRLMINENLLGLLVLPWGVLAPVIVIGIFTIGTNLMADGITQLEHLILTYPQSVLVPQARRLLDQARGAVPRT